MIGPVRYLKYSRIKLSRLEAVQIGWHGTILSQLVTLGNEMLFIIKLYQLLMISVALQTGKSTVDWKTWTGRALISAFCITVFSSVGIIWDDISAGGIEAKYFYFDLIIGLTLLISAVYLIYRRISLTFHLGLIDILLIAFTIYVSAGHALSGKSTGYQYIHFVTLAAGYFILKTILQTKDRRVNLEVCLSVFLGIAAIEACFGILQLSGIVEPGSGLFSVTGSFHNPGPFGIYLAMPLVLASALILNQKINDFTVSKSLKVIASIAIVAIIIVLPFTESRTAWLSAFGGISYLLFNKYAFEKFYFLWKSKTMRVTLCIIIAAISIYAVTSLYYFKPYSASGRLLVWTIAAPMTLQNPILGLGAGAFKNQYGEYQAAYFSQHSDNQRELIIADQVPFAYNDYLQVCIEYGFVGLLLFLAILISAWRTGNTLAKCLLITCIISSTTSYAMQGLPTILNLYLAFLICGISQKSVGNISVRKIQFLAIGLVGLSAFLLVSTNTVINHKKSALKAERLFNAGFYEKSINEYQSMGAQLSGDLRALSFYGKALAINGRHSEAVKIYEQALLIGSEFYLVVNSAESYQKTGNYDRAEKLYLHAVNMIPNRLYPRFLLARFYQERGEDVKARQMAKTVIEMKEKVPSLAIREMKQEMTAYLGR